MTIEEKAERLVNITLGNCALDGGVSNIEERQALFEWTLAELKKMGWTEEDD